MAGPEALEIGEIFDIAAIDGEIRSEEAYLSSGHTARTLVKEKDLKIVVVALKKGAHIADHRARGTTSVHAVKGRVRLRLPGGPVELDQDRLLVLEHDVVHDVEALTESTLLLTIGA